LSIGPSSHPTKSSKRKLSGDVTDNHHETIAQKRQRCVQRPESAKPPAEDKRSKVRTRKSAAPITSSALWARALVIIESADLGDKNTSQGSRKYSDRNYNS